MRKLFALLQTRVAVAQIICATALFIAYPVGIYADDVSKAYYIPAQPQDRVWWSGNIAAWKERHPGNWVVGVSGFEKEESAAMDSSRHHAEKQIDNSEFLSLQPSQSVIYYKSPNGKMKVWQLYQVIDDPHTPEWVSDFEKWRKKNPGNWMPPTASIKKNDDEAINAASKQAQKSIEDRKDIVLELYAKYIRHLPDSTSQAYLLFTKVPTQSKVKYGYLDVFGGQGAPTMSLEFTNSNNTLYLNQLGLAGAANGPYKSVKWDKLKTDGFGPVGVRIGGYGDGNTGGSLEFGVEKRNIKRQSTTFSLNDTKKDFRFITADYLTATSFYLAGNLMVRVMKRTWVEPYFGVGAGISLSRVHMPHVGGLKDSSSLFLTAPTNDTGSGFMFNVPIGVRIKAGTTQIVAEMRYQVNRINFDRGGINGEADTAVIKGMYFNIGLGFNFLASEQTESEPVVRYAGEDFKAGENRVVLYNDLRQTVEIIHDPNRPSIYLEPRSKQIITYPNREYGVKMKIGGRMKNFYFPQQDSMRGVVIDYHIGR